MTTISPAWVKELREKTGAGMMDCKRALLETEGDLEKATDWLRTKGLAAAAKKAGRAAAEGLVGLVAGEKSALVLEVNTETDFVARNEEFQKFVGKLSALALEKQVKTIEALALCPFPDTGRSVQEELSHMIASIGEHMNLRRLSFLQVDFGVVCAYVHAAIVPGMGRIGVLAALETSAALTPVQKEELQSVGKQIAMHIAAAHPQFLSVADVDAETLLREKQILTEQARESGRPEAVIEKMIDGRLRKYFEEVVLEEQLFVMDSSQKISQVLAALSQRLGMSVTLKSFVRFALGEGIEKAQVDFAAEVQAQLKS